MASKFQNRLMGTVILVALGVILLPGLLDGQKKHYEEKFASIPLVPKAGDEQEGDVLPPVNQRVASQLEQELAAHSEAEAASRRADEATMPPALADNGDSETRTANAQIPPVMPPEERKSELPADKLNRETLPKEVKPVEQKPVDRALAEREPVEQSVETPPSGQAYVVQLGALKNANKVEEIVAKLRFSGYSVYTIPSKPVAGQLTRIYVGPNTSKQQLQSQLAELQKLSGLSGQVRNFTPR